LVVWIIIDHFPIETEDLWFGTVRAFVDPVLAPCGFVSRPKTKTGAWV